MQANEAALEAVRAKLARLGERCYEPLPDESGKPCPGWFVCAESFRYQRCDECWAHLEDPLTDDEVELLPEAQEERVRMLRMVHEAEHATAYGLFAEWCPHCLAKLSWLKRRRQTAEEKSP